MKCKVRKYNEERGDRMNSKCISGPSDCYTTLRTEIRLENIGINVIIPPEGDEKDTSTGNINPDIPIRS